MASVDMPATEEARVVAEEMGCNVIYEYDVGVASLFTSELAVVERVAKASSAPADPLVTSSSTAYSTLHRPAEIAREPPLKPMLLQTDTYDVSVDFRSAIPRIWTASGC